MIQINYKELTEADETYSKNQLYRIRNSRVVQYEEQQDICKDIVLLQYNIKESQYGFFAHEYRNPMTLKNGGKAADVFAGIIDENEKKIYTIILDVKHNISAFADDLYRDGAIMVAVKYVRDFVQQIKAEILHKDSLFVYYKSEGYSETEKVGIATTNFDADKFKQAAGVMESLIKNGVRTDNLVALKLRNSLAPYESEIEKIKMFSEKKIQTWKKVYDLDVYLLENTNENEFSVSVKLEI